MKMGLLIPENRSLSDYYNLISQYSKEVFILNSKNFLTEYKKMDMIFVPSYEINVTSRGFYPLIDAEKQAILTSKGENFRLNNYPFLIHQREEY